MGVQAHLAALAIALMSCIGATAMAGDRPVVVELYTSQGCSSCPPADALLGQLADDPDVIALALHVDYWDYIGWKDEFGKAAHSDRQRKYAAAAQARTIYTPQMVIEGKDHLIGTKAMQLAKLIQRHKAQPDPVTLSVARTGANVQISAASVAAPPGDMIVQVVHYLSHAKVDIRRGENAGHQLDYHNIVQSWDVVANWDGQAPLTMDAPTGGGPVAVIIQLDGHRKIVAAAKLP